MNRATWCGRVGALCSLVMLVSPSPVPAQELTFGFFDATVTLPTAGTTSYPGWSGVRLFFVEGFFAYP